MERFVKGDVVVLPFPYTDFSGVKKRPAVVVANLRGQNVILAQITTNQRNDEDLVSLRKKDFSSGSLSVDSFIMASFWSKTLILFAGVTVNFLFAWGVFTMLFWRGISPLMIIPENANKETINSYLTPTTTFLIEK